MRYEYNSFQCGANGTPMMNGARSCPCPSQNGNGNYSALMRRVQELSFALYDTALYLDAYPCSGEAIAYYKSIKKKLDAAVAEYEEKFGPLSMANGVQNDKWVWAKGKFPWQYDEEG